MNIQIRVALFFFLFLMLTPVASFGQDVVDEEHIGETLSRMHLLSDRYEGKTMFFLGVELVGVGKLDDGTFCLTFEKPTDTRGMSYSVRCYSYIKFVVPSELAILVIDAGRGKFIKAEGVDLTKRQTVRIGFNLKKARNDLLATVFEIADEGFFRTRSVLSSDIKKSILCAAIRGDSDTIEALARTTDDVNVTDNNGKTALMYAAEGGREKSVKILIAKGADMNAKSAQGRTALAYAKEGGKKGVIKIFEKAGAKE